MRVLIVGLGSIARKHMSALQKIDSSVEIIALRSSKEALHEEGIVNVYSFEELSGDIDFAVISNPTSCHASTIEHLIDKKMPLFIEKPVFESLNYDDLVQKVITSGTISYVACNLRFHDCLQFVKSFLSKNPQRRINEVNVYCGSYLPSWRPNIDYKQCYSAIPELGGGAHLDLIHEIDYVYWLFGEPMDSIAVSRNKSTLGIRAVDYANYIFLYPTFTASIILNYYRKDYKRTLEIVFEDETWTVDLATNTLSNSNGEIIYQGTNTILSTYERQMRYFLSILEGEGRPDNDIETAYKVLKMCLKNV